MYIFVGAGSSKKIRGNPATQQREQNMRRRMQGKHVEERKYVAEGHTAPVEASWCFGRERGLMKREDVVVAGMVSDMQQRDAQGG